MQKKDTKQASSQSVASNNKAVQKRTASPGRSSAAGKRNPSVDAANASSGAIGAAAPIQRKSADSYNWMSDPGMLAAHGFPGSSDANVQLRGNQATNDQTVHHIAAQGVQGGGGQLPHQAAIQKSFGSHDISGVKAHVGGAAGDAAANIGAEAYATGNDVAFQSSPSLHTAAHEAAHVVQQRAGVSLKGGVGQSGDAYERNADAVADRVVQGESAEDLLGSMSGGGSAAVQSKAVQKDDGNQNGANQQNASAPDNSTADDTKLKERAGQLFSVMQAAWTSASTQRTAWVTAADQFGLCYKNAFDSHETVRKQQAAADKLIADICFGVLSLACGGVLGSLTNLAKNTSYLKNMSEWKVEGITPVVTGVIGKAVEGIGKPAVKEHKVGKSPLTFHLDLKNAVNSHAQASLDYLNKWVQFAKDVQIGVKPLSLMENLDPAKLNTAVNKWKTSQAIFRAPGQTNTKALTKELEIGLWARWTQKLHSTSTRHSIHGTHSYEVDHYSSPGGKVEARLTKLGIPVDTGWYTSDAEVKKLIAWGASWKPSQKFNIG